MDLEKLEESLKSLPEQIIEILTADLDATRRHVDGVDRWQWMTPYLKFAQDHDEPQQALRPILFVSVLADLLGALEKCLPDPAVERELAEQLLGSSICHLTIWPDYKQYHGLDFSTIWGKLFRQWNDDNQFFGGNTADGAVLLPFWDLVTVACELENYVDLFRSYADFYRLVATTLRDFSGSSGPSSKQQDGYEWIDTNLTNVETSLRKRRSRARVKSLKKGGEARRARAEEEARKLAALSGEEKARYEQKLEKKREEERQRILGLFDGLYVDDAEIEAAGEETADAHAEADAPTTYHNAEALAEARAELDKLIGLDSIKAEVQKLSNVLKMRKERLAHGLPVSKQTLHFVFTGNPGTGKTTVARILARILHGFGVLKTDKLIEAADRSTLVGEYSGQTAPKTRKVIDEATDGVLFIDEAYNLAPEAAEGRDSYGQEAINTLLKKMEDLRDRLVVIVAGYPDEMEQFLESNPGLKSRFSRHINFPDYHFSELCQIYEEMCQRDHNILTPDATGNLEILFERAYSLRDDNFGNGRFVRNVYQESTANRDNRLAGIETPLSKEQLQTIEAIDLPFNRVEGLDGPVDLAGDRSQDNSDALEAALADLNKLIGLDSVKAEISRIGNFLKVRHQRLAHGMSVPDQTLHFVFTGNPGTGKTTVARILARILSAYGILKTFDLVEATRDTMVAGYSGQTAIKTSEVIDEAVNGALFIDEAHTLAPESGDRDSFGQEAIDMLLKKMEDLRDKLVVIVAGYPNKMQQFLESNPGLKGRFTRHIKFPDYRASHLCRIFEVMCIEHDYYLNVDAQGNLAILLSRACYTRDDSFDNGRLARRFFELTLANKSDRLAQSATLTEADLKTIQAVDLPYGEVDGMDSPLNLENSRWNVVCPACGTDHVVDFYDIGEKLSWLDDPCCDHDDCIPWWNPDRSSVDGLPEFEESEWAEDYVTYRDPRSP